LSYLYCEQHGREHEAGIAARKNDYLREDETMLVVRGTLISDPWHCDSCNVQLKKGMTAILVSAFPGHCSDQLHCYDFGYERQYFAMTSGDTATAYGAEWPDDSIRKRTDASSKRG
jgi:hypothetical protein